MTHQVVLVHRDGATKTCLGATRDEATSRASRVAALHRGAYVASFMPMVKTTIPTVEAKRIAEGCR